MSRILVMHDHGRASRQLADELSALGVDAQAAPPPAWIELLIGASFDLIVGDALAMALSHELLPDIHRCLIVTTPDEWTQAELKALRVDSLLIEPWTRESLDELVLRSTRAGPRGG